MLATLERAGVSPVPVDQLHAFAFFANVLSPLWRMEPLEGSVLKRKDGPFYRAVQDALDGAIADGLVEVIGLAYRDAETGAQLAANVRINLRRAQPILTSLRRFPDEAQVERFLEQLAFVFAEIDSDQRDEAVEADATYGAPGAPDDRVVDFAEYRRSENADHSVRAAKRLQAYAPAGVTFSRAEELVLYMRLLRRRARALSA